MIAAQASCQPAGHQAEAPLTACVVVPSYRRPDSLVRCLDALMAGTRLPQQVVVVMRDTDADTHEALESWRGQRREGGLSDSMMQVLVREPGQIPAMEAGRAAACGDVVCFVDDDCVPRAQWLDTLLGHYDDLQVGGVGGRDVVHHGAVVSEREVRVVGRITWYGRVIGNHHCILAGGPTEVQHLKGANMSFRRAVMAPFDPNMNHGSCAYNDTDACLAVRAQGLKLIYDPDAQVDHYPAPRHDQATRAMDSPRTAYTDSHNWVYCLSKWLRPGQRWAFVLYALLVGQGDMMGLVKYLLAAPRRPVSATCQFVAATRGKLVGLRSWRKLSRQGERRRG